MRVIITRREQAFGTEGTNPEELPPSCPGGGIAKRDGRANFTHPHFLPILRYGRE